VEKIGFLVFGVVVMEWVLLFAVRGISTSGRRIRRQRVTVFEGHRLPSTGSRWDIRWVRGGGKSNFCVFSLAIMESGFEACG
jgi:hypothetical protein